MSKKQNKFGYVVMGLGVIIVGGWRLAGSGFGSEGGVGVEGVAARRGPLKISVVERGNLKATDSVDLVSEIEGSTTVLWLIDEGVLVQPGDRVCELDTANLVERRVSQEISVQNTEAAFIKAQQNLAIQKSQNESDIKRAEREKEFARADLRKYLEGDWPQARQGAEEAIVIADEKLTQARQVLEWSKRLFEKGFLEQTQLDKDELAETSTKIGLNQARRALQLLEQYDFPRQKAELEADVEEKIRELERVKLQAAAKLVDHEANKRTTKARFDLEAEKFAKLDSQIEKAVLIAPVAGMVVYAVEDRGHWGGGEPMQEGANIRERQKIITIPSSEGFVVETSLHENVLEMVDVSQPCVISVDALSELIFTGRVKFKAVLPDKQSWYSNPDMRVYRAEVQLIDTDPRLRPGMSCSVEILVDQIKDALYIPLQSVYLDGGFTICFVSEASGTSKRSIEVGQNNGRFVHVESGLHEGEIVCLARPAGFSLEPAKEEEEASEWSGPSPEAGGGQGGRNPSERTAGPERSSGGQKKQGSETGRRGTQGQASRTSQRQGGDYGGK